VGGFWDRRVTGAVPAGGPPPRPVVAFYEGWADHQERLLAAITPLTDEQMQLRAADGHWAVWQLGSNMAGGRTYWLHDILGEGDRTVRDMLRVDTPTVPGVPIEDAGWEDDEDHPRTAADIVDAFRQTWTMVDGCLQRWTDADLQVQFSRERRSGTQTFSRAWVIWHLIEHELQHGAEIALILRANGLPTLDL
jgi:uncharacterized damage-inducible protein DinB